APLLPWSPGDSTTSTPKISRSWRRSIDTFSGRTTRSRYPRRRATTARPMPVLPEDGSRIVSPGRRLPSASASSTIFSAIRSFDDPPGFWPSSFAHIRTAGFGDSSWMATSGVSPISPRTSSWRMAAGSARPRSTPRDGGEDGDRVAVGDLGVEALQVPDVVVVAAHVYEAVEGARAVGGLGGKARIAAGEGR